MASPYLYSAALYYFMRRTTISHFAFLISNSRKAFIHNQWTEPPHGLPLNLFFKELLCLIFLICLP